MAGDLKSIKDNLLIILTVLISLVWLFVIGVDYINKHPAYDYAFQYFRYTNLCLLIVIIACALIYFLKLYREKTTIPCNGISAFILGMILCFIIIGSHKSLVSFKSNSADQLTLLGTTSWSAIQLILIGLICRSSGQWFYRKFLMGKIKSLYILDIALGLIVLTAGMFILGLINFLNTWSLLFLLVLLSLLNIKGFINNLKTFLVKSLFKKGWGMLGKISIYLTFTFILINLVSVQSPFPSGFDSRNYYMNISNLLAEQGALISGYPPYNGSLINAIGLILFDQIELALSISLGGIILVLLISYQIAVDKLRLSKDRTAFLIALLVVIPAIVNQMYIELKVDFMLLFFQLLVVYYLFEIDKKYLDDSKAVLAPRQLFRSFLPVAAFLGILLGFGMGIKMINLFLVVVIFVLLLWDNENNWAGIGVSCLGLMIFLLGGIDEMSGLNQYHLNTGSLALILGISGLLLMGAGLYFHRNSSLKRILFSGIVAIFLLITISPWVIKNYADTRSLNPKTVLMGSSPGPDINVRKLENNYKKTQNN